MPRSFFDTPPGNSGNTPAATNANPNSAIARAISNMGGDKASAVIRALEGRGNLMELIRRKRRTQGGLFDDVGQGAQYEQTIGFGIKE